MHIPIPKEELGSNKESFRIRYRITLNYRPWACYVHTIPVTELEQHDTVVEENVLIYSKTTYKIRESPLKSEKALLLATFNCLIIHFFNPILILETSIQQFL